MKILKLSIVLLIGIFLLTGCSVKGTVKLADSKDAYKKQLNNQKLYNFEESKNKITSSLQLLQEKIWLVANDQKYSNLYVSDTQISDNINGKLYPRVRVKGSDIPIRGSLWNSKYRHIWQGIIYEAIKNNKLKYIIEMYGISTKQIIKGPVYFKEGHLYLGHALKNTLKPDRQGFIIKGYGIFNIPNKYLPEGIKNKSIILNIQFGKHKHKRSSRNEGVFSYLERKYIGYNPNVSRYKSNRYVFFTADSFKTVHGTIQGYKIRKNLEKHLGWENSQQASLLAAEKERKRIKKEKQRKYEKEKSAILRSIKRNNLENALKDYANLKATYSYLASESSRVDSLDCSSEIYDRFTSLLRQCKSKRKRMLNYFEDDMGQLYKISKENESIILDIIGSKNTRAFKRVVRSFETINDRKIKRDFPYANADWVEGIAKLNEQESDRETRAMRKSANSGSFAENLRKSILNNPIRDDYNKSMRQIQDGYKKLQKQRDAQKNSQQQQRYKRIRSQRDAQKRAYKQKNKVKRAVPSTGTVVKSNKKPDVVARNCSSWGTVIAKGDTVCFKSSRLQYRCPTFQPRGQEGLLKKIQRISLKEDVKASLCDHIDMTNSQPGSSQMR